MNNSPEKYVEKLLENSQKKYKYLEDMLKLTEQLSAVMTEEGMDTLEKLIADRQAVIEKVDKLDEEFNVYFSRLKHELKVNSLDELKDTNIKGLRELKDVVAKIMDILKEMSQIDKKNNDEAKKLFDSLGTEIKKINQGKMVNTAYYPKQVQTESYFIDKKK